MRLPAVAIAAAFAGGIACGRLTFLTSLQFSRIPLLVSFIGILLLLLLGIVLARKARLVSAGGVALCSWMFLGVVANRIEEQPLPADHVLSLIETGQVELKSPLRWKATLRDEPQRLPWGTGMDVELAEVKFEGSIFPCRGGMRITYAPGE